MTSPSTSAWGVYLTRRAEKDLDKHRSNRSRIEAALTRLETDSQAGERLTGDLAGAYALHSSVPNVQFRAAYVLREEQHEVWVFCIGPRENFYDEVRRRYPPNLG